MKNEILNASNIYKGICLASSIGKKWGISVKELKKKYKLRNRDINSLISFLKEYAMSDNSYIEFEIYKFLPEVTTDMKLNSYNYDELGEYIQECDYTLDTLENDVFIRIQDRIFILGEKINENSIDIRNASLTQSIYEIGESWNKISDFQLDENYILIKEEQNMLLKEWKNNKKQWITGIVKGYEASIEYKISGGRKKQKEVLPMGMYYNKFLTCYICIYLEKPYKAKPYNEYKDIPLDEILSVRLHSDEISYNVEFNVDKYIKSNQKDKMVLYVFHEGKVGQKLKNLLADNQLKIKYDEDYDIFTFMTEDPWQYIKVIKSYGRSVIAVEPEEIREDIIDNINNTLDIYKNINTMV